MGMSDYGDFCREQREWRKKQNAKAWKRGIKELDGVPYDYEMLTAYQYRFDGWLDIFPQSGRYHDIKKNQRGFYTNLRKFLAKKLKEKYQ